MHPRLAQDRRGQRAREGEVGVAQGARGRGLDDLALAESGAKGLSGPIEFALLDLRALQLNEDALVLDRAEAVASRLRRDVVLVRRDRKSVV